MHSVIGTAVIFFASLSPCRAGGATNDFDPDVDFTHCRIFAIIGGLDPARSGWLDEHAHEHSKNFVSGALETRGLVEVPAGDRPQQLDMCTFRDRECAISSTHLRLCR